MAVHCIVCGRPVRRCYCCDCNGVDVHDGKACAPCRGLMDTLEQTHWMIARPAPPELREVKITMYEQRAACDQPLFAA